MKKILYLHGLFSTPDSSKAIEFKDYIQKKYPKVQLDIPLLSCDPSKAIETLETLIANDPPVGVIGSSMGGFHSIWISAQLNIPAVLINPAIQAGKLMSALMGKHTHPGTGEQIHITKDSITKIQNKVLPENLVQHQQLCLLQTGDAVIDYKECVNTFTDASFHITKGGDHNYINFSDDFPLIERHLNLVEAE